MYLVKKWFFLGSTVAAARLGDFETKILQVDSYPCVMVMGL